MKPLRNENKASFIDRSVKTLVSKGVPSIIAHSVSIDYWEAYTPITIKFMKNGTKIM